MNSMCNPIQLPEYPEDYPVMILKNLLNQDLQVKEGPGFSWLRSSRMSLVYHSSWFGLLKLFVFDYYKRKVIINKLEMLCQSNKE